MTPTSTTDEAYGAGGNLLLRYTGDSNSRSFVPFAGGILAEYYCGGMIFDHPDEIGSLTTATNCAGNVVQERLSYPFGEFWNGAGSLGMHQLFAQLPDYDPETDQYNTENRHYTPSGRWLSPDPDNAGANPQDPQTWNMYAYVRNNPTSLIDPSGAMYCDPSSAVVDKNGSTVGYSDCVSEETGKSDQYSQHFAPQQENVNAQQGSLLDYLLVTTPTYVPNDVPLPPAGQKVAQDLSKIIDTYPTVCGGGGFLYTGRERSVGSGHIFVGAITEIDSRTGTSTGGLFEIGGGEGTVAGGGYIATTNPQGAPSGSVLAYGGVGASAGVASASGGVVGFGSGSQISGAGIYGEGSLFGRVLGGGGYLNITNVGSCHP